MNATRTPAATTRRIRPAGMTVLYDANCPVCRQAWRWVETHRQLVQVRFIAAGSPHATRRFPGLDVGSTLDAVTVVTDDGAVFRGERAWFTVLWAVAATRTLAVDLAAGRRRWAFRRFKGATEAIRRLASDRSGAPMTATDGGGWPPPDTTMPNRVAGTQSACNDCGA